MRKSILWTSSNCFSFFTPRRLTYHFRTYNRGPSWDKNSNTPLPRLFSTSNLADENSRHKIPPSILLVSKFWTARPKYQSACLRRYMFVVCLPGHSARPGRLEGHHVWDQAELSLTARYSLVQHSTLTALHSVWVFRNMYELEPASITTPFGPGTYMISP